MPEKLIRELPSPQRPATDNGNVMSATIVASGAVNASRSFTHDTVNRLITSGETGAWTRNYSYDAWGNGWVTTNTGLTADPTMPTVSTNFNSQNQLMVNGASYDAAGNQTTIAAYTNFYDAENRMVTANLGTTASTGYVYDGDGRRAQKVSCPVGTSVCTAAVGGATVTDTYVYDAAGQLAAEYETAPAAEPCTTCYLTADTLGSTRMITDGGGTVQSLHDYLPFGEEIPAGTPTARISPLYPYGALAINDGVNQKFTGKERDQETGLDFMFARYYSSAEGRLTTPDWSATPDSIPYADLNDPQTLNLYAYVVDDPLDWVNTDGHDSYDPSESNQLSAMNSLQQMNFLLNSFTEGWGMPVGGDGLSGSWPSEGNGLESGMRGGSSPVLGARKKKKKKKPALPSKFWASIYADMFEGSPTSSGDIFHQSGYTSALLPRANWYIVPMHTRVRLTHAGRSVVVEINDRGKGAHAGGRVRVWI